MFASCSMKTKIITTYNLNVGLLKVNRLSHNFFTIPGSHNMNRQWLQVVYTQYHTCMVLLVPVIYWPHTEHTNQTHCMCDNVTTESINESQYVKKWTATIFLYDTKTSVHCCLLEYTNKNKCTTPEVSILCLRYSCIPVIPTYSSKHFKRLTRGVHEEPITDLFQTLWEYKFPNWRTINNFFLSHFQTSLRRLRKICLTAANCRQQSIYYCMPLWCMGYAKRLVIQRLQVSTNLHNFLLLHLLFFLYGYIFYFTSCYNT